jgi:hypothetical protein
LPPVVAALKNIPTTDKGAAVLVVLVNPWNVLFETVMNVEPVIKLKAFKPTIEETLLASVVFVLAVVKFLTVFPEIVSGPVTDVLVTVIPCIVLLEYAQVLELVILAIVLLLIVAPAAAKEVAMKVIPVCMHGI